MKEAAKGSFSSQTPVDINKVSENLHRILGRHYRDDFVPLFVDIITGFHKLRFYDTPEVRDKLEVAHEKLSEFSDFWHSPANTDIHGYLFDCDEERRVLRAGPEIKHYLRALEYSIKLLPKRGKGIQKGNPKSLRLAWELVQTMNLCRIPVKQSETGFAVKLLEYASSLVGLHPLSRRGLREHIAKVVDAVIYPS